VLVRSAIPSYVVAAVGLVLGVLAIRGGEKRVGWGAVVACVAGAAGAYGAVASGVGNLERVVVWSALLAAALRYATPLTFAALGGVISERSGVVNIGLEGMMLIGAFFGAWGADVTDTWVGGILIGLAAGGVMGLLHAVFAVSLRADQIVSGTAINFLALGITGFLYVKIYGEQGTPDDLPEIPDVHLPIGWIPFLGDALEQLNLMIWLGLLCVAALSIFLFRTPRGLRLRSVGENPLAADTAGISPIRVRYYAVVASGAFAALGGVFLSIGFVHSFSQNMTIGKGFIGLAAVIFGKWKPGGALAAALLFGFSSALAQRLPVFSPTTAVLFQALPYVLTLIAVAGLVGRSRPPAADGVPYER
jgi:general nucleoside transport system permease protein